MATLNANPIVYHQKAQPLPSKRKALAVDDDAEEDDDAADPWTPEEVFG